MANDPDEEARPEPAEEETFTSTDGAGAAAEPLTLDRPLAPEDEEIHEPSDVIVAAPAPTAPPRQRKRTDWGKMLRNTFIWGALLIVAAGGVWYWLNKDTLNQPAPIPAKYQAWGDACTATLRACRMDIVRYQNGTRWLVDDDENDVLTLQGIVNDRFASVADVITMDDPGYVAELRAYLGRTAPQPREIQEVPLPSEALPLQPSEATPPAP